MRVAVDVTPLLDARTGVGAFVRETTARLASRPGTSLVGFGFTRRYLPQLRAALPPGMTATRLPVPARTVRWAWRHGDLPPIELWTGRVDVVHGPNFEVPPSRRAARLVTVHDLTAVRYPEMCDANTIRFPDLIRRAVAGGAHVHTVSRFVADEVIEAFDAPRERIHVIPNGVDTVETGRAAAGHALAGGPRYVLAVGTVEPRKNLGALVEAVDLLAADDPDLRLVLAGATGWGEDDVAAATDRARHPERVVRLGRVSDEQRADLLAGAAVLAYPSHYEGFGLPPLEAMAAGTPVVASRRGALPEVLGAAAELTEPDPSSIAAGLGRVLDGAARRDELIALGRAQAARYSWDRCASELHDLYRRLAEG